jgi:hypothetical protein
MVEEMIISVVVVEVEEVDVDLVVKVKVVEDHIVLIDGKMIMTSHAAL